MGKKVIIDCRECGFRKEFGPDGDELPADTVISHGQETGHKLTVNKPEQ